MVKMKTYYTLCIEDLPNDDKNILVRYTNNGDPLYSNSPYIGHKRVSKHKAAQFMGALGHILEMTGDL